MEPTPLCAWTRLYHPRGPQVTLPLPTDPVTCLKAVSDALDAGWLVQQPGLEEGEEKEQVGHVLRSVISSEKGETPFVLLYAANDALTWSFLKVYLNTEAEVKAFEHAARLKLADLPEYVGQDKPQRGANPRVDRFIVAVKPFGVVFKKNPKHDSTEQGKMKPARLFVRWADTAPAAEPTAQPPSQEEMATLDSLLTEYRELLRMSPGSPNFHAWLAKFFSWVVDAPVQSVPTNLTREQYQRATTEMQKKIDAKRGGAA